MADNTEKAAKKKKKDCRLLKKNSKLMQEKNELDADEVYHISSGDEDCSKGMKSMAYDLHLKFIDVSRFSNI